jgi:hypothetical protein
LNSKQRVIRSRLRKGKISQESCRLVGEIINVSADESVLGADGKIDPEKLQSITFDSIHSAYRVLGEKVDNAFQDGAKGVVFV